jgi:2,3-dihydroxybenzoate decarboxylase
MGETLAYLLWRLDSRSRIQSRHGPGQDRMPSEITRKNIAITTAGVCSHAALLCALEALGEDNVMFPVDYPYEDCGVAASFVETALKRTAADEALLRKRRTAAGSVIDATVH